MMTFPAAAREVSSLLRDLRRSHAQPSSGCGRTRDADVSRHGLRRRAARRPFGDGHRGDKESAVTAIETGSVRQAPGSPEYGLTAALRGDELVFLLVDPKTERVRLGSAEGLAPLDGARLGVTGRVLAAPGLTVLTAPQAAARGVRRARPSGRCSTSIPRPATTPGTGPPTRT
ncbi:hypothetical protein [Nonomuraea sp. NPDC048916]|uniref:hypothetical protein n=1 Tax=Nonomuraea sp. NPDC048916 TaxID=3154232 RepID=UPI0033CC41F8